MSDEFNAPGSAIGIQWEPYLGRLLLIDVKKEESGIPTAFGTRDAIRAAVTVLDGPTAGEGYADTLVFPQVLQGQLRGSIGGKVLGRLGQGVAKSGQKPPWKLEDPTDADKAIARAHLANEAAARTNPPPF
jgi:hypothetical protein